MLVDSAPVQGALINGLRQRATSSTSWLSFGPAFIILMPEFFSAVSRQVPIHLIFFLKSDSLNSKRGLDLGSAFTTARTHNKEGLVKDDPDVCV